MTRISAQSSDSAEASLNPVQCLAAIRQRDRRRDGAFFYGVRSTRVFCRPSCASRQPRPENIQLFASAAQATAAGFRACRRCRPEQSGAASSQASLMAQVCRLIESCRDERLSLQQLGSAVRLSPYHLQRTFRKHLGVTPRQYAAALRVRDFKQAVRSSGSVTEALYEAGYGSSSRLYESAGRELGTTPGQYRAGSPASTVHYTIGKCALGWMLVAATGRGVCAVRLGDSKPQLVAELREEFPAAALQPGATRLRAYVAALLRFMRGAEPHLDLPLDIRGTAFQRRVWDELRRIPPGETVSYQELAGRLGQKQAARAVGSACARNPVAMVIPCHRVVSSRGALTGYRWGLARKRELLRRERAAAGKSKSEA